MKTEFPIYLGKTTIGLASIRREGLYYSISCRCRVAGNVPPRIKLKHSQGEISLGICVPMQLEFGIDTKIAVKYIGQQIQGFEATAVGEEPGIHFVPVASDIPFHYIASLKHARMTLRGNVIGVTLQAQSEMSKPTGQ